MRQDLLAVVGGNFYHKSPIIFEIGDQKCVWFDRDDEGYLQLNFRMPTIAGRPRAEIEQNFWTVSPAVNEVVCPPNGRRVEVFYHNGDKFKAEFFDIASTDDLELRYPQANTRSWSGHLDFPLTGVELWETAMGTPIEFGPDFSKIGGHQIRNGFMEGNGAAIHLEVSKAELAMFFPQEDRTYVAKEIYLTDLIDRRDGLPRLEGFTFTECQIRGPIVAYPFGAPNAFTGCNFQNPIEAVLFEVPEGSLRTGAVPLIACRFTNCNIDGVGILGTSQQLAPFRQMATAE